MKTRSMQASSLFVATLVAAGLSAFAALPAHAAGRVDFAANGQRDNPTAYSSTTASRLTRSAVRGQTLAARAEGTLTPAGEGEVVAFRSTTPSTLARAEVKAEVIAAERAGELQGQGEEPVIATSSRHNGQVAQRNVFSALFARHHAANAASGT
jgi:hypothetical protein